ARSEARRGRVRLLRELRRKVGAFAKRMEGWKLDPRLGAELLVVFGVAVSLWVWGTTLVGDARVDDAYITFAFSKNLALGKGPIYGFDLRVEGYSNFLWMILSSLGELIGTGALAAARFFSHGLFG